MNKILLFSLCCMLSSPGFAYCSQQGTVLGKVGIDERKVVAEVLEVSTTRDCGCRAVVFDDARTDSGMAMSILLTAKMVDKQVRIDFADGPICDAGIRVYIH